MTALFANCVFLRHSPPHLLLGRLLPVFLLGFARSTRFTLHTPASLQFPFSHSQRSSPLIHVGLCGAAMHSFFCAVCLLPASHYSASFGVRPRRMPLSSSGGASQISLKFFTIIGFLFFTSVFGRLPGFRLALRPTRASHFPLPPFSRGAPIFWPFLSLGFLAWLRCVSSFRSGLLGAHEVFSFSLCPAAIHVSLPSLFSCSFLPFASRPA